MLPDYAVHEKAIGLDWYELDPNLRQLLDRLLPDAADRAFAEEHAAHYGTMVGGRLAARADETDAHGPRLVDGAVVHHPTWTANKDDLTRAGFVGLPHRAGRPVPAVVTAALAYLVCQAETAIYCGLGMTAGAVDIVERYAPEPARAELLDRLTSLDPDRAWEGGMFLSEKQGGSDVGANTTVAVQDGDEWLITGDKHYCSNVDAEVFIVLARPEGAPAGSRGLATFIIPRLREDGSPNGFTINRLKPKLGTTGVPTAEVSLRGARAWLAGSRGSGDAAAARDGRGVNRMMEMVNGSRFGVALMGLGIHRRSFLEAAIYAARRQAFGHRLDSFPMVRETLVDMVVELEGNAALAFACAAATRETADPIEGRLLRRILVPLAKITCTRSAIGAASSALEIFGGNGYMEDWPMARQLRDAQCHTIWEGTENICSLDVRRAIRGEDADQALLARVDRAVAAAGSVDDLTVPTEVVAAGAEEARRAIAHLAGAPDDLQLLHARRFAFALADVVRSALLLEEATWAARHGKGSRKAIVARSFARRLAPTGFRGVFDDDRTALDDFELVTRYG